jgi:hypothetical protein
MSNFNGIMIIFCLVLGEDPKRRFSFDISRSGTTAVGGQPINFEQFNLGHIQKLLCEKKRFEGSDPEEFDLWKVSISTKQEDDKLEILKVHAQNAQNNVYTEIDVEEQLGGVPLKPEEYIKDIFAEAPLDKHIHIVTKKSGKVLVYK